CARDRGYYAMDYW
nr:immunoglobulin heavy chain junction region [Mus musculus]NSM03796.1 immunoglobulin heavy chain junction region [Mus musculus]NSM03954.1 immunoglobulin heavy chain junction region [Mus musculus]NSM03994.1 immunoglobulin heavy chain junction region [Mus musculus]NSM04085.1 immunoglobulin heavy chain junction region [Mus musculus]